MAREHGPTFTRKPATTRPYIQGFYQPCQRGNDVSVQFSKKWKFPFSPYGFKSDSRRRFAFNRLNPCCAMLWILRSLKSEAKLPFIFWWFYMMSTLSNKEVINTRLPPIIYAYSRQDVDEWYLKKYWQKSVLLNDVLWAFFVSLIHLRPRTCCAQLVSGSGATCWFADFWDGKAWSWVVSYDMVGKMGVVALSRLGGDW